MSFARPFAGLLLLAVLQAGVRCALAGEGSGNCSAVDEHGNLQPLPGPDETDTHWNSLHEVASKARWVAVPLAQAFCFALVVASVLHQLHISWLPESLIIILVGALLGIILQEVHDISEISEDLNSTMLNLVLLPVIIFQSGWSLRRKDFAAQFTYILLFAIVGTLISTGIVGSLILLTSSWHGVAHYRTAFAFASLISATDPVATLSTYSSLNVDPLLNIMVLGESTINDAVAIVLFNVLNDDEIMGSPCEGAEQPETMDIAFSLAAGVCVNFVGAVAVGIGVAMIQVLILRCAHMRHNIQIEILFLFVSGFSIYALAESFHFSGIIAVFFGSCLMGTYARPHMSSEGCMLASFFIKQIAVLADMAVFLLVGVDIVLVDSNGLGFALFVMGFCVVSRLVSTVSVGAVVNFIKACRGRQRQTGRESWHMLSGKTLFMMWHAGLRGAIALVLSLELGDWVDVLDGTGTKQMLRNGTFLVIIVFLFIFGGTTECALNALGIPMGSTQRQDVLYAKESGDQKRGFMACLDRFFMLILVGPDRTNDLLEEEDDEDQIEEVLKKIHDAPGRRLTTLQGTQATVTSLKWRNELHSPLALSARPSPLGLQAVVFEEELEDDEEGSSSDDLGGLCTS